MSVCRLIVGLLFFAQTGWARGPEKAAGSAVGAITLDQIAGEPVVAEIEDSLRWSPDGEAFAWTRLVAPPAKGRGRAPAPQREVWGASVDSDMGAVPGSSKMESRLLVSTARVTEILRGTKGKDHPQLENDVKNDTSLLLREIQWAPHHRHLLLAGTTSLAWLDFGTGESELLAAGEASIADSRISEVQLSPDGRSVSFVRRHQLWIVNTPRGPAGSETANTQRGEKESTTARLFAGARRSGLLEGEADWPYRNELHVSHSAWWSRDSRRIAYLETDERGVATYALRSSDGDTRTIVYPEPGGKLPSVRVWVKALGESARVEMHIDGEATSAEKARQASQGFYVPRMVWLPDGRRLAIELLDRDQRRLRLFLADALTGKCRLLLTEEDTYWINLSDDLHFLKDGRHFLWSSERSGFRHLYLYDTEGGEPVPLTHGDWEVTRVDKVDEAHGFVYFTATEASARERQVYRISLDPAAHAAPERITQESGTHRAVFSPTSAQFADIFSNTTSPPQVSIRSFNDTSNENPGSDSATGQRLLASVTIPAGPPRGALPRVEPVEFVSINLHLGAVADAFLIKPPGFDASRKYPVIVYLAGGPGEQLVRDEWMGARGLWMQSMAQKGFVVFAMDNQGTAGRGHWFEEPIHLRFGAQELADQREGLAWLRSQSWVDGARIGVCGWGFGGFLALHAMLDRPVEVKAGFAGAAVSDWRLYDAVFTERYLDLPERNVSGWEASTPLDNARFLTGDLIVAQGTEDESVHMENALTLQNHLLDTGKTATFLLFPDRGHAIEDLPARRVLWEQMTRFFQEHL
jgi:dipeptidyl-peptidase-4